MHRIDTSGNVNNRFHPGNPATGQQATLVDQDWLNAVQEEIVNVILQANIDLEKGTNDQLAEAIIALIAGVVGDGSGAVPTTRQLLVAGGLLAISGTTLAADRTLTLTKATVAEAAAQVRDDVVVTPAALAGLVGLTQVGGAWVIRIGPVIAQIFSATVGGNSTTVLSLPQAFPTEAKAASANGGNPVGNAQDNGPYVNGVGLSTVSVFSAIDSSTQVNILAFGR